MVGKKNIRSYEVSIWTLQDSFITVLKPLNLEHKGAIQDGKITLQDDGENRISFSIPMYIREKGEFIENPLWYNTEDGNLIANLRKLKVIFNKTTTDERVFEFIITKVTENHEGFEKTCEIEGEGLAFNELGKQGYKISLSEDDLYNEVSDELDALGENNSTDEISVKNNINYWIDKVLAGTNWSYSIQMDWSIVDGVIDQYEEGATRYSDLTEEQRATLNFNRESKGLRRHDRIYEDAYVSSWSISNNALIPAAVVESTEKLRMVEGNESNRYNLLQSIAEAFEVYTKYKYYYDDNYHIIGREVIFYNNFLDEDNTIDLTYDYDTQSISRELDAADIVTKMYVKTLDDESYPSGLASIMDTKANKTGEDYILNFDYLYDIKTISEEQYAAIKVFEKDIANLNNQIKPLDNSIIKLESKLIDREVARDNALAMMKEAEENINFITEQLKAITEDSNYSSIVTVVKENPAFIFLSKGKNNYLGKFGSQFSGIVPGTVKVYSDSNCTISVTFSQKIKNNMVQNLIFTNTVGANVSNGYLYATFDYRPALEKEKLQEDYQTLYNRNKKIYEKNLSKVSEIENSIKTKKATRENLYANKIKLISDFENMMGPALREGNWQPEDEYVGYGDQYDENIQPSYDSPAISTTSGKLKFIWDKELFDEEEENYYEYGINQQKVYYPCIDLTKINSNIFEKLKEEDFRNGLSFVYKNPKETNPYLLPQGTNCKFAFIKSASDDDADIIPVLMITNLYNETNIVNNTSANKALKYLQSLTSYIAYITDISIILSNTTVDNSTIFSVPSGAWIEYPNNYKIVYPRLEIQSDLLKTGTNELLLHIYREKADPTDSTGKRKVYTYIDKLEEFTDYSIFSRNEKKYITIKPEVLLAGKIGEAKIKINYCLTNTALQIYLDAIEIMKENAYPKVSYTISQLFSPKLFYNTYDRLGQLAHINDAKLKFKNVMGYISAVELNLDKPWEDNITIQNYKNKFEDLFSTIVAQTEDMKKNAYRINAAANAFSANGLLTAEVTPESLLKSARVLNNLIKRNADVIAAKAISEAAKNKAALASTDAYRIMHGEVGLAFKGNKIDSVVLNQDKGLIIAGKTGTTKVFFQLDNAEMGFFKGTPGTFNETNPEARPVPQLYYENGNLTLSGVMYAASGWFGGDNGWIIGSDKFSSNFTTNSPTGLGGLLYSANGKAIFTSLGGGDNKTDPMIILTKTGFSLDKQNAALLFDGTNLYISGTITSTAGNIGGWHIGSSYLGDKTTQSDSTVGMASGKDTSEQSQKYSFWAGGKYSDTNTPLFYVTPGGYLHSEFGQIGGWYIGSNYLGDANSLNNSSIGFHKNTGDNIVLWAGNTTRTSAPFSITAKGALTSTSGTIANWSIGTNQLNSGSGETYVALNSGTYNSSTNPNGEYAIWAGNATPASASFSVTKTGVLTATGADITGIINANTGYIGGSSGWIIKSQQIYSGTAEEVADNSITLSTKNISKTINDSALTNLRLIIGSHFGVTATGALYASNAVLSGSLKAGDNFSVTNAGVVTAKSGSVGGWTLGLNYLGNASTRATSTIGISIPKDDDADSFNVFWAGGTPGNGSFKVTKTGKLVASDADIAGTITATSGTFTGTINARSGTIGASDATQITIGNVTTNSTKYAAIYNGVTSISDTAHNGFYLGANGIVLGKGVFKVTSDGAVTASNITIKGGSLTIGNTFSVTKTGVITATSGTVGGWTLGDSALYLNNSTPGYDTSTLVLSKGTKSTNSIGGSPKNTEKIWMISASDKFGVTTAGDLYANSANITGTITATNGSFTGTIYATAGRIGGTYSNNAWTGGWVITAGRLYSGDGQTRLELNSQTTNNYAIWAGNNTASSAPFNVTKAGKLTATGATINGNTSITANNVNITGKENSSFTVDMTNFKVTDNGNVTVTGKIIAKDGSIAGWTIGNGHITTNTNRTSYNASSKGMTMTADGIGAWNDADNYFTLSATGGLTAKGANITGQINASSGSITGGLTVSGYFTTNASRKTYNDTTNKGITISGSGIGGYGNDGSFTMTTGGKLTATGADISGIIKATTGEIGSTNANKITLGDGTIHQGKDNLTDGNTGFFLSKGGIALGKNSVFKVTGEGVLTAQSGSIGGWTIGSNYIGSAATRGNSEVGMSTEITSDHNLAFWAGGKRKSDTYLNSAETAFFVTNDGQLTATKANIIGKVSATSGSFGDGTNKITITTNDANSAIYGGSKTKYTSTNNGFYIGTNGIALGAYNSTSGHSPFEISTSGILYASGAIITGTTKITGATKISTTEDLLIKTSTTDTAGCVIKTTTSIIEGQDASEMFLSVGKKSKISLNQYGLGLEYGSDENDPSIWVYDDSVDLSGKNISLYSKNLSIRANAQDNDFGTTSFRLFLVNGHTNNATENGILIDVSPAFIAGSTPNSTKTTYQGRGTWVSCNVYVKISSDVSYEA